MNVPGSFWQQDCHQRGAALTHAHWNECRGAHPGTGEKHLIDQCCHCGERALSWQPRESLSPPVPTVRPAPASRDHAYLFTIAGRCGQCQGFEDDHPIVGLPDPMTGCDVDHNSIRTALLIGDGGQEWTRCPRCAAHIEPRLATGQYGGRNEGRGRGYMTERHRDELARLVPAWLAGQR